MWRYKTWRRRRILARNPLPEALWREARSRLPLVHRLDHEEQARLRDLTVLFLHEKIFEPVSGLELTDAIRLEIALQACLPILNLGLDWYDGWRAIIVYPGDFVPQHEEMDEAGVVHLSREPLSGESWQNGPVILSLSDSAAVDGGNLVIHEFAHKLDMLNGDANGLPPLHREMSVGDWAKAFSTAFEDFQARVTRGESTAIDDYAAEDPAEFFAVLSEVFFESPSDLGELYPAVYKQLRRFYRQDPAAAKDLKRLVK